MAYATLLAFLQQSFGALVDVTYGADICLRKADFVAPEQKEAVRTICQHGLGFDTFRVVVVVGILNKLEQEMAGFGVQLYRQPGARSARYQTI